MISPLSQSQLGIYLSSQGIDSKSGNYQQASLYLLPEDIDIDKLKTALEAFVAAHPYILSHTKEADGMPVMETPGNQAWSATVIETPSIDDVRGTFAKPMDLNAGPLFRMEIYKTGKGNYLYVDFHHIIFDGACVPLFLEDVGAAYRGETIAAEQYTGADIAREEEEKRASEEYEQAKAWYAEEFGPGAETASRPLPDVTGAEPEAYKELFCDLALDSENIKPVMQRYRTADSVLYTTLFGLTLAAWSAEPRASFCSIWNGRSSGASRRAFTMCVHTIPVLVEADPKMPLSDLLKKMKDQTVGIRSRAFYSFADCSRDLGLAANVSFGFQGKYVDSSVNLTLGDVTCPAEDLRTNAPGIGLSIEMFTPSEGPFQLRFWYRPDLYTEELLRNFARSFAAAVLSMANAETVGELRFADRAQIATLDSFNPSEKISDGDKTVLEMFGEHVRRDPSHPAIVSGDVTLSYADVDRLSDNLAAYIEKNVAPGGVVSIILGRNEFTAVAPLGALKAGCCYQPLDPSYPKDRLQYMVKDASSALLIADEGMAELVEGFEGPVLKTADIASLPAGKPKAKPKPEDLFILLYTSGTTGVPKGCMLIHRNISIYVRQHARRTGIGPDSRLTAYASFGFDAFVGDLYGTLAAGATIYVIPEDIRLNLVALRAFFEENAITHSFMTTQVATQFAINYPECKHLEVLFTGGEKLSSFPLPKYKLYNCYGPTESICYVISKEVTVQEPNIPIGIPLPGTHAYVVSKGGSRLPVGAAGELLVTGRQVGNGYLGLPEKTAEAFAENPYEDDPDYRKLYRTGDIVRYREDGDIEFIGRRDAQVKIRGFRIELSEVETVIREFPGIKDVTVQAFDEEGAGAGKYLAAYVVAEAPVDIAALNAFILENKPPYMVPAVTMQIDAIPLNVNHKVDKKALPKPEHKTAAQGGGQAAPFNILEEEIAALIKETTGLEGMGVSEPLILYGLNSLSALRLATELYNRYGVEADMRNFAKVGSIQSIENEILKSLLSGGSPAAKAAAGTPAEDHPQEITHQQEGVYYECLKAPHETVYNIPMMWRFPDNVTSEALKAAAEEVLAAHPVLHSHFEQRESKVILVPGGKPVEVTVEQIPDTKALKQYRETFVQPFDLATGPLGRVVILQVGDKLMMATDFHHLVFDGMSYDIFAKQLCKALDGEKPQMEAFSYFKYAALQKEQETGPEFAAAKEFFTSQLAAFETPSSVIPDISGLEGVGRETFIQTRVTADIHPRCQALGISPASYYLAAAYMTVAAYSGSSKVYMCTVSNGRTDLRTGDTFGMFVNTLTLVGDVEQPDIDTFLKKTDNDFQTTLQHQNYPFSHIATEFGFQPEIMLAYQVGVLSDYRIGGQKVESDVLEPGAAKFPISIFIDGAEGDESIVLAYDPNKYSEELMKAFANTMECVVRGMLAGGDLNAVPFVDGDRLSQLDSFNPAPAGRGKGKTIVDMFRECAAKYPDAPATLFMDTTLTYSQLDDISDRLAAYIAANVAPGGVVSVIIDRNQFMTIAPLGVLKAGCAYQPLDPSYPKDRLSFMVKDAEAALLIADPGLEDLVEGFEGPVLSTADIASLPIKALNGRDAKPEDLFILLYTSGTTGVPKGVMLEHGNLVNFCHWYHSYYKLKAKDRVAAYASFGFDANMMDLYPALTSGACVCIIPEDTRHDMSQLNAFLLDNKVTHSFMTTQVGVMYAVNYPDNPILKHLSVGGEKLVSIDPPKYALHNGYGPTECTIFSTIFEVKEKEPNIPIGHPLLNGQLYVVDKNFRRLPVGAAGELLIAGAGVGRGYLNRPDKTAESFIENPFEKGMRAYRSGDIVRYRPDGNIEFVGRRDGQVKIRGFRVELKEVEAVIREMPEVQDVTVQVFDSPSGGKFIAAYVVADGKFDAKRAGDFIRERKPAYMVPASFTQLEKIPLNVNQKVDKKALPKPVPTTSAEYVAPVGPVETALCEAFAEVLHLEKVGATDNFFDLGGTSLVVTNVLVAAEKRGLQFAYADVFAHPTARSLAAFISGGQAEPSGESDVAGYDYTAIDRLLSGNTLEALVSGQKQPLGKQIILTGATGFLGIHFLRELIHATDDDTVIWCLLRSKGSVSASRRLREMLIYYFEEDFSALIGDRIRVVEGDITDTKIFDALLANGTAFDMVVNCAANVKHFSKGNDIEAINYGGVKNLVSFCQVRRARLIQVSTESVGGMSMGSQPGFFTEQQLYFGQQTDNQYVHSKFLAERHILQCVAEGTLDAKIMRAGNLSPRASDGEFQVNLNSNSAMGRIRAYKMLGACPYSLLEGQMEFSPIDQTAQAMVLLSQTPRENCVFNVSNNHMVPMEDILSRLEKVDNRKVDYVEFQEFIARMQGMMNDPAIAPMLSSLVAYARSPMQQEMVMNIPSTGFTMQALYRLGFRWDHTSSVYIDMIFDMLKSMRYFEL